MIDNFAAIPKTTAHDPAEMLWYIALFIALFVLIKTTETK